MNALDKLRDELDAAESHGRPAPTAADIDRVLDGQPTESGATITAQELYAVLAKLHRTHHFDAPTTAEIERVLRKAEGG